MGADSPGPGGRQRKDATLKPSYDYKGPGQEQSTEEDRNRRWHSTHMTRQYPCIEGKCDPDWEGFAKYGLKQHDPMAGIDAERSRRKGLHQRWCVGAGKPCKTSRCDPDFDGYGDNGIADDA